MFGVASSQVEQKQIKVKFFPIVRFGSSLCLRMVVVANAAAGCKLNIVADGSNKVMK
jgi:hypothetical protein